MDRASTEGVTSGSRLCVRAGDESTNNWVVALLTFGEGWHNNHHAFPRSARHDLGRLEIDLSWLVIRTLARLGLAPTVRLPTPAQMTWVARIQPAGCP